MAIPEVRSANISEIHFASNGFYLSPSHTHILMPLANIKLFSFREDCDYHWAQQAFLHVKRMMVHWRRRIRIWKRQFTNYRYGDKVLQLRGGGLFYWAFFFSLQVKTSFISLFMLIFLYYFIKFFFFGLGLRRRNYV